MGYVVFWGKIIYCSLAFQLTNLVAGLNDVVEPGDKQNISKLATDVTKW